MSRSGILHPMLPVHWPQLPAQQLVLLQGPPSEPHRLPLQRHLQQRLQLLALLPVRQLQEPVRQHQEPVLLLQEPLQ